VLAALGRNTATEAVERIVVDSGSSDENGTSTAKVEPGWDEPSASCWWTT
jgi:hypothetical protein